MELLLFVPFLLALAAGAAAGWASRARPLVAALLRGTIAGGVLGLCGGLFFTAVSLHVPFIRAIAVGTILGAALGLTGSGLIRAVLAGLRTLRAQAR